MQKKTEVFNRLEQEKLAPATSAVKKRAREFEEKMSKVAEAVCPDVRLVMIVFFFVQFGDKVVKNPLMQELGHTTLTMVNGGLRGSAAVFNTLDKVLCLMFVLRCSCLIRRV